MKKTKKSAIIICMGLMAVTLTAGRLTSIHQSVGALQTKNVEALTDGDDWAAIAAQGASSWLNSFHCRCHSSENACFGGNLISFRGNCYKGPSTVACHDYDGNCQ